MHLSALPRSARSPRSCGARRTRAALAAIAVLAGAGLSACSGEDDAPAKAGEQVKVIQPGAPGEAASTLGADAEGPKAEFAHDDVAYMQMMIPHHEQALAMSRLAPEQASSPAVKKMAARILAAQGPEIIQMAGWLKAHDLAVPTAADAPSAYDHGEHGHATMHGMLTDEQMAALKAARGAEFDRLFLTGMIQHHQGAVEMADEVAVKGTDVQVSEIAADVILGQSAEIERMQEILTSL